jgi:decaprenyl-phosphate phosphoribosyltransferase
VTLPFRASVFALRPKQWVKNLLLFVAPFSAGINTTHEIFFTMIGFLAFSMASSIGYVFNDLIDVESDRRHPKKKSRPFASGILSVRVGFLIIGVLTLFLLVLLSHLPYQFSVVIIIYILNTLIYTKFLKKVPVLEMFTVAFGFVLRLIAGGVVINLAVSEWFLLVGGFGALFVVAEKRLAEKKKADSQDVRRVVKEYTSEFLYSSTAISVAVCVASYCFWAFRQSVNPFWFQISVIPFVMALFQYRWVSERDGIEAPEDAILRDVALLLLALFCVISLTIGIYR